MSRALHSARRITALALLAGTLGGCMAPLPGPAGLGIETDGRCVYRDAVATDPDSGESIPVRERFCGGRPRLAG